MSASQGLGGGDLMINWKKEEVRVTSVSWGQDGKIVIEHIEEKEDRTFGTHLREAAEIIREWWNSKRN